MNRCSSARLPEWDIYELLLDDEDRCPNPATCLFDNGLETIPLCAQHYDLWCADSPERGNGNSPVWETYEP